MNQTQNMSAVNIRQSADGLAQGFTELLAEARQLAANISLGAHGRRRAGMGEEFWQYRAAVDTDAVGDIDWRRSARSDAHFVRQQEWQNTQSVHIWADRGGSMAFRSNEKLPLKMERANVLALALSILLTKAGEKVGLLDLADPARQGVGHVDILAAALIRTNLEDDFLAPPKKEMKQGQKAVFISDFLGDWEEIFDGLSHAAHQNVDGYIVQVLDPVEQDFPFKGRTVLLSMNNQHKFETMRAQSLRKEYQQKLAERKAALQQLSKRTGWRYSCHTTNASATPQLLWLSQALGGIA
ncbi:DUF58 domain-containing protein [Amylibacter sp. SFDW26]|uniref:DUF58 domain-containing protein n=1 Tax=Amylibacter sp. SFDW26 TaxID=2652722 RepID=UPI00126172DB|nr:DUF58 domain-containing protein [Amylibacter sp. SFDW26]KAB7613877.1 DUF58 domain-containing protein [Amylibacter sp. SFDW26]